MTGLDSARVGKKLFVLLTVVPLLELALLVVLGDLMGLAATLALVITTALAGAYLSKREGLRVLRSWQESLALGRLPTDAIMSGVLVLAGGIFLITPGVLTDALGILLLIPPTRRWIARRVERRLASRLARLSTSASGFNGGGLGGFVAAAGAETDFIDVEASSRD